MNPMSVWCSYLAPPQTCGLIRRSRNVWGFADRVASVARVLLVALTLLNRVCGEVNLGSR
jgi:hypothetical protein